MNSDMPIDPLSAAAAHAELGLPTSSAVARLVHRMSRVLVEPQRAYNRGVVDAVHTLREEHRRLAKLVREQEDRHERVSTGMQADIRQLQIELSDSQTTVSLLRGQLAELVRAIQRLEAGEARVGASDSMARPAED
jgi:predicted RNase H-like nuclease (RuvC/YqgF family)